MDTAIRDAQLANYIDQVVDSINFPDVSFTLNAWEAVVGTVVTVYEAFATPESAVLQQALRGIAI